MIIENPNNFVLKDLTCQYIKNELLQYEKDNKIYHKDTTDRRLMIDLEDNFSKYKTRNKKGIYYYIPDIEEFEQYIQDNFNTE